MKINLTIDPKLSEERVDLHLKTLSEDWEHILDRIHQLSQPKLTAHLGRQVYFLATEDIDQIVIENKEVLAKSAGKSYQLHQRLYQLLEILPANFLQISQSEIINMDKISHLEFTPKGLVKIFLTSGDYTFSSRRYLKAIKEALKL